MSAVLSESSRVEIQRLRGKYPDAQSALLPTLCLAQSDYGGWLPDEAFDELAIAMDLPAVFVRAVASFYTMLREEPAGRHLIQVCTNIACSLLGAKHLTWYIGCRLGIGPGQTTPDGIFTLLEVECLGSCGTAPVMQVDDRYYENLTEGKVDRILVHLGRT